ncbi:olfactory receptor 5AP2-like [Ascaphus truei]|uniref:olfactory receptor 5AP2-like n=1 Tax=Ascaphus truei TaxID=8439 RepID=UPI003F5AA61D
MTIFGNVLVVVVIQLHSQLHTPMYFFLVNLSFLEILYTSTIIPNTLRNFLREDKAISFVGCFTQMFIFISLGGSECVLLGTMAYDRYVAICRPLQYNTIMSPSFCFHLALFSWSIGFLNSLVHTIFTAMLPFCHERLIKHYFCEIPHILKLSCKDTQVNEILIFILGGSMTVGSLILTLLSYTCIVVAVLRIPSINRKRKAFSTCTSHLLVVSIFFGTVIFIYLRPTSQSSSEQDRVISVVYGVVTPLFNPVIYSFRNKEFQRALQKVLQKVPQT